MAHKIADGGGCWVHCGACKRWDPVDLSKLIIERGPLFSLWNRRPKCRCGGRQSFHAHHAPGTPVIPLTTTDPHYTDDIHKRYEIDRRRRFNIRLPPGWDDL